MTEVELAIIEKKLSALHPHDWPEVDSAAAMRALVSEVRSLWAARKTVESESDAQGNGRPPDGTVYCPHSAPGRKPHAIDNLQWKTMEEQVPGGRTFFLFYCGICGRSLGAQCLMSVPKALLTGADILPFAGRGGH